VKGGAEGFKLGLYRAQERGRALAVAEGPSMAMVAGGLIEIKEALIGEETEGDSGGRCDSGAPLRIKEGD
jgi:hypothetical protein